MPSEARVSALPSAGRPPAETEAGPRLPSAPGLVFRLLLLCVAATGKCSGKHHELLLQLQRQADLMQNPSTLLDPYVSARPPWGAPESQRTVGGAGAGVIPREDLLSLGLAGKPSSTLFLGHSDHTGSNPETSRKRWAGLEGEPRLHHLLHLFARRARCTPTTGLVLGTGASQ